MGIEVPSGQNESSAGESEVVDIENIRKNIVKHLTDTGILAQQETSDLTAERVDGLVVRTAHDLANLPDIIPEQNIKKVRRILGLTQEKGQARPSLDERNEEISQVVGEMRAYLENFKKGHPYIVGFVLCGSRIDRNKIPVVTSDVDVVPILKSGYTCDPKTPEGEKMLRGLRSFSDNTATESGFPVELDEIYSTDEFTKRLADKDKVEMIWGWNPEAIQYIGDPISNMDEGEVDKFMKDAMNSQEIKKIKSEMVAEAYKKVAAGERFSSAE